MILDPSFFLTANKTGEIMAEKKPKMVKVEFSAEKYSLIEGAQSRIFGVLVEPVEDKDGNVTGYVGECTEEEAKAFKDAEAI